MSRSPWFPNKPGRFWLETARCQAEPPSANFDFPSVSGTRFHDADHQLWTEVLLCALLKISRTSKRPLRVLWLMEEQRSHPVQTQSYYTSLTRRDPDKALLLAFIMLFAQMQMSFSAICTPNQGGPGRRHCWWTQPLPSALQGGWNGL